MKRLRNKFLIVAIACLLGAILLTAQQKSHDSTTPPPQQILPDKLPPSIYGEENLHSLAVGDSKLHAADPIPGEKAEFPEFTRELVQVQWRPIDPIHLYVIKPHGVAKPPVAIYLYSYPSETDRFRDNEYCKRLVFNGYAAVGLASALTGQRYHDRPMKEWFVSEMPTALTESVHDVQMVLQYLAERGDVDLDHVGIFGTGSGATIALLVSTVESRIRAIDALQPWGDWAAWLAKSSLIPEAERANYLKPAFLASVAPLDPVALASHVQAKNLRVQFALDDTVTPAAAIEGMKAAMPPTAQVLEYQTKRQQYEALGGGHAFDWLKQQLRPSDPHAVNAQINAGTETQQNKGPH
jgi:dienelactone hydrolase